MKTLYFDCFAGVSGNMVLGAIISLGVDPKDLKREIAKLQIPEFDLEVSRVDRAGIEAIHVRTVYNEDKKHRHLAEIESIIENSALSDSVRSRSVEIFRGLAHAEAMIHGVGVEEVHFHEVGAMDAIIDVVGACVGFEILEIGQFQCSKIHTGSGFIDISHGTYPVPPPAVTALLKGFPVYSTGIEGELATPTGAAILSALCTDHGQIPEMVIEGTGYGAGSREYADFPNVLRIVTGETSTSENEKTEALVLIETNLDDATGETLGFLMDRSMESGALDCWFTPIQMKKGRPGHTVSILCKPADKQIQAELLYTESSTIGIRTRYIERECLARRRERLQTQYGEIGIKVAEYRGRVVNVKPEFEEMAALARKAGVELKQLAAETQELCAKHYEGARIVEKRAKSGSR